MTLTMALSKEALLFRSFMNCRFAFFTQWTVNILKAFSTRREEQLLAVSCLSSPNSNIYFHHYMKCFFYAVWMKLPFFTLRAFKTARSKILCIKNILFIFFAYSVDNSGKVKWKNGHKNLMLSKSLEIYAITWNKMWFLRLGFFLFKRMMNFTVGWTLLAISCVM